MCPTLSVTTQRGSQTPHFWHVPVHQCLSVCNLLQLCVLVATALDVLISLKHGFDHHRIRDEIYFTFHTNGLRIDACDTIAVPAYYTETQLLGDDS